MVALRHAETALEAVDLIKTYSAGRNKPPVRALRGLSFHAAPGTVFGLLGPNGAGKSTTVKILSTLAAADSGSARVAGIDVAAEPDRVRRAIGVVAQRPGTDPMATAAENLLLAGRIHGMSRRDATARAGELVGRFGLTDAAHRPVRTYSGGMARKLDVALGLVHRPQVLFLDEADRLADRIAIVDHGTVVASGTPDELKSDLRGDAVLVELAEADPRARAVLERMPVLRDVTMDGATVRGRTDDGARALPAVLAALEEAGFAVTSATIARPSLDDVYLRHAGRGFDAAGGGAEGPAAVRTLEAAK
ncbi:ATP-binding cassette domain-containing protein [Streptomyces rimosus]